MHNCYFSVVHYDFIKYRLQKIRNVSISINDFYQRLPFLSMLGSKIILNTQKQNSAQAFLLVVRDNIKRN